jgi:uncharacterized protein (DUF736 family)
MMPEYSNELRGVLFVNDRKESETHPDYTGTVTVNGVEYFLDGWRNVSKKGTKFLALKLKPKDKQPTRRRADQQPSTPADEDVPF